MISLHTPLPLIGAFLVLTLAVGLASKKPTTFREYAVDNKRLSTVTLLATLLATAFCGVSLMSSVEVCYTAGLSKLIFLFIPSFSLWLTRLCRQLGN